MKLKSIRFAMLALALVAGTHNTFGQNANSGEIKGIVTDSTGAVIPAAQVKVANILTGVVSNTTTNASGIYDLPSVEPGKYSITVSKPGFSDMVRNGITLTVGTIAVDATLRVGSASQEVVVTADASLVQTEDSGQHMDFDAKAVQDAPVVGGIWYTELTNELPGINGGGSQDASGQGIGINGTQGYSGSFLIEGSTATQPRDANASDNYPPIDAIGEVNVQTANFGSQYGNGVASFNVLLKGGTNRFHGSAFEFIQNDAFDARGYFNPGQIQPLRWNEFGGSVGGPIIRNKLFFYFTYQRNPAKSSSIATTTVPTTGANGTANMTAGCFPSSTPVINPTTKTQYPNNCITGTLDPIALNIQKYFPAPNLVGPNPYLNNYRVVATTPSLSQWYVGKVDYVPTKSHRLSVSYMDLPITLVNGADAFCALGFDCSNGNNYNMDGQVTDVWTINDHMVNEARVGGVREKDLYVPPTFGKGYPTTIGLEPQYGTNAPGDIFPTITIDSGSVIGGIGINGGVHADLADGSLAESDVFTLVKGKHTIKIGGEFDKSYQNYTGWGDVSSGGFEFNGGSGGATQESYADFLLGDVYGWYVFEYAETGARSKSGAAFVQDDFKITPHLSLNIGLRWQFQGGWGEVDNRWGTFDPTVINAGQFAPPNTLGGISFGGRNGRQNIQNSVNEWAPRLGLSYSPVPKWAFRASYGITDVPWSIDPYTSAYGVGINPQASIGYSFGDTAFKLKTGPPANSVVFPNISNLNSGLLNYQNVNAYSQTRPIEYYQETLVSVQHEIPSQILLDVSYVHTKGTHLGFTRDINAVPTSLMSGFATGKYNSCFNDPSAYPLFCSIGAVMFDGISNYDALQVRAEKRLSYGLSFIFNYALAKTLDTGTGSGNNASADVWQNAFSVAANYGLSTLDVRHTINGSATYELPFGSNKLFKLHGVLDEALGGWRATGVYQVHSGIPYTVTATANGADESGSEATTCSCGYAWFANQVGNPTVSHKGFNPNTGSLWFNPGAFATPSPGTFGTVRRNSSIGPNWRNLDFSLGKTFALVEGVKLEIRADSYNIFNHPNFAQPSATVGSASAGVISSASGGRNMQLGGRFTF